MITIVLTVSRFDYLEKVMTAVELLQCDRDDTNLLCIVDGEDDLFLRARNLVRDTKFLERLTVKAKLEGYRSVMDVPTRRRRVAAIHNQARDLIKHTDGYVFSIEDDTTFSPDALQRLLNVARRERAFGFAEGVEVGRWGTPYIGAWLADDVYEPKIIRSLINVYPVDNDQAPTRIDMGGLYCALIKTELYKWHEFNTENGLGPDFNFGLALRQQGYDNFIVWQVPCTHHNTDKNGYHVLTPAVQTTVVTMTKNEKKKKWDVSY